MKNKNKNGDKDFITKWCFWYWLLATFIGAVFGGIVSVGLIRLLRFWGVW